MSVAADLQDRRRAATQEVERKMLDFLVARPGQFGKITIADAKEIATAARNYTWDALVEVTQ